MILSAILIYVSLWFCAIFGAIKDGISDRAVYRYNDEHMRIEYEPWHGVGWLARDFPILLMFLAIFLVLNITDFIMIGLILSIHIYLMILLHEYFYSKSANEIAKVNMNQLYRYIGKIIKKVSML